MKEQLVQKERQGRVFYKYSWDIFVPLLHKMWVKAPFSFWVTVKAQFGKASEHSLRYTKAVPAPLNLNTL